jgi:hypothetical protein
MKLPRVPKKKVVDIHTPEGLFELPALIMAVGARGQGKTVAICRIIKSYLDHKSLNHVYVISPTLHSQLHLFREYMDIDPDNLYQVDTPAEVKHAFDEIQVNIDGLYKQHLEDKEYVEAYRRLIHHLPMTPKQEILLERRQAQEPGKITPRPIAMVLVDDCQSLGRVLQSQWFASICLRHRHLCSGASISICVLCQSLRSSLSKSIRQNASGIILFGTHDKTALQGLYEECSAYCDKDTFYRIFDEATQDKHSFLAIDLCNKDKNKVFSKNLDSYFSM